MLQSDVSELLDPDMIFRAKSIMYIAGPSRRSFDPEFGIDQYSNASSNNPLNCSLC
jgi:hypothetical protein